MGPLGRGVRVEVYPRRRVGVGLAGDDPVGGVEGVPVVIFLIVIQLIVVTIESLLKALPVSLVVDGGEVHHEHVVLHRVHPVDPHLVRREHAPARNINIFI